MWKVNFIRRPPKRRDGDREPHAPARRDASDRENPFADLVAKLDQIPYTAKRRPLMEGR
jgi:hypothetical protein